MKTEEAIEILEYHQQWRLGKTEEMKYEPKQLTEALDLVLMEVKRLKMKKEEFISKWSTWWLMKPEVTEVFARELEALD